MKLKIVKLDHGWHVLRQRYEDEYEVLWLRCRSWEEAVEKAHYVLRECGVKLRGIPFVRVQAPPVKTAQDLDLR